MSNELYTSDGQRKYLTQDEQARFLSSASQLDRADVRTFCMTLAFTGCRISEALQLTVERVDLSAKVVRFRTLKKRDKVEFRAVPVPDHYLDALKLVHDISKRQKLKHGKDAVLWSFKRAMASRHVDRVMKMASIEGTQASAKGLRHGFGVRMAQKTRNPRLVQKLLGHSSLETTAIYMDLVGDEERAEVLGAW